MAPSFMKYEALPFNRYHYYHRAQAPPRVASNGKHCPEALPCVPNKATGKPSEVKAARTSSSAQSLCEAAM